MIASGLSPLAPEEKAALGGRLFLEEIEAAIQAGDDFAFETTLSGRGYLKLIDRLREEGWRVDLHYIALPNASGMAVTTFRKAISSADFRRVCVTC